MNYPKGPSWRVYALFFTEACLFSVDLKPQQHSLLQCLFHPHRHCEHLSIVMLSAYWHINKCLNKGINSGGKHFNTGVVGGLSADHLCSACGRFFFFVSPVRLTITVHSSILKLLTFQNLLSHLEPVNIERFRWSCENERSHSGGYTHM